MRKRDEMTIMSSCLNKAKDGEMMFVLLGRDEDAPDTIRDWIKRRIKSGRNKPDDPKMIEAEQCACAMEADRIQAHGLAGRIPPELAKNAVNLCSYFGQYADDPITLVNSAAFQETLRNARDLACKVEEHLK